MVSWTCPQPVKSPAIPLESIVGNTDTQKLTQKHIGRPSLTSCWNFLKELWFFFLFYLRHSNSNVTSSRATLKRTEWMNSMSSATNLFGRLSSTLSRQLVGRLREPCLSYPHRAHMFKNGLGQCAKPKSIWLVIKQCRQGSREVSIPQICLPVGGDSLEPVD